MKTPGTGTAYSYTLGFIGSLICTFVAFGLAFYQVLPMRDAITVVFVLAIVQLLIQLLLFLHMGRRGGGMSRAALAFALIIVGIVVIGSLWIMHNLNGRMMPGMDQQLQYMENQS